MITTNDRGRFVREYKIKVTSTMDCEKYAEEKERERGKEKDTENEK